MTFEALLTLQSKVSDKYLPLLPRTPTSPLLLTVSASLGMDASVMMQAKETEVFARLKNIVVTDANSQSLHRKVPLKNFATRQKSQFRVVFFFFVFCFLLRQQQL